MSRKFTAKGLDDYQILPNGEMHIWAEEMGDDYHTIHELYQHRMALNIALFNEWARLRDVGGVWEMDVILRLELSIERLKLLRDDLEYRKKNLTPHIPVDAQLMVINDVIRDLEDVLKELR